MKRIAQYSSGAIVVHARGIGQKLGIPTSEMERMRLKAKEEIKTRNLEKPSTYRNVFLETYKSIYMLYYLVQAAWGNGDDKAA